MARCGRPGSSSLAVFLAIYHLISLGDLTLRIGEGRFAFSNDDFFLVDFFAPSRARITTATPIADANIRVIIAATLSYNQRAGV